MSGTYRALVVRDAPSGGVVRAVEDAVLDGLPDNDTLIRVGWSALNYKDALSATGNRGVTRRYPHTPGIDAAGVVVASADPGLPPGTPAVVTGFDLGMNTPGGFGQYIRVPSAWVVRPEGYSAREAMVVGTAGFTAALSLLALEDHGVKPGSGEILVTGATGGVGSLAVAILDRAGYTVAAGTGKPDRAGWLRELGAAEVIDRAALVDSSGRPMLKGRWAGVIDTVGGGTLATAIKTCRYGACIAVTGLVASPSFDGSVFPFILRGLSLVGIDSAEVALARRRQAWDRLSGPWRPQRFDLLATDVPLDSLDPWIDTILTGGVAGRVVVHLG